MTHRGKQAEARFALQRALPLREHVCGRQAVDYARLLDELAWLQICDSNIDSPDDGAIALLKRSLVIKVCSVYLEDGADLSPVLCNPATPLDSPAWQDTLNRALRTHLPDNTLAISINRMAVAHMNLARKFNKDLGVRSHNLDIAKNLFDKSLALQCRTYG